VRHERKPPSQPFELRVECYAGYKADEKPRRFFIGDHCYEVEELIDQWYGPDDTYFRVRADDGNTYILRHTEKGPRDVWTLESFRRC
jgi:hypothetical protein